MSGRKWQQASSHSYRGLRPLFGLSATRHGRAGTGLRDTLLPQLLSGRLTVRQAAELVG